MFNRSAAFAGSLISLGFSFVAASEPIVGVTAKATSAQVIPLFDAQNVCVDRGLTPKEGDPGSLQLTTNGYAAGGNCWHSGYIPLGADERPLIEFDLGKIYTVEKFRVWNYNGAPHRGFREVSLDYSVDGKSWQSQPDRFTFKKSPKSDEYLGEEYLLPRPVRARHIRFFCESTYRSGVQPDLAGLGKVRFYAAANEPAVEAKPPAAVGFPHGSGVIDVQAAPYFAKGDGQTDDTAAIQQAIDDYQGRHRILFLRPGTYLISAPLRDESFDAANPRPVLTLGYNGREDGKGVHADWFNNNVCELAIDIGRGNPGAIGLQYSNNVGSLRDVEIRSADVPGAIGLDLGYADQNGPCLVKNVSIRGFATGIRSGATVNSQTFDTVQIVGATQVGWENGGQCLAVHNLKIESAGPAFVNKFGVVALVNVELHGRQVADDVAAVTSHETLFARNLKTTSYKLAIDNRRQRDDPTPDAAGPNVDEWVSTAPLSLFPGKNPRSLNLPIQDAPEVPWDEPADWANIRHFRDVGDPDDTAAVQRAVDSGATTVFFPAGGRFFLSETVELR